MLLILRWTDHCHKSPSLKKVSFIKGKIRREIIANSTRTSYLVSPKNFLKSDCLVSESVDGVRTIELKTSIFEILKPGLHYRIFSARLVWNWHGCLKRARQTLFTLHHFYRIKNTVPKFLGPGNFSCRHAQFSYNQERLRDFGGEWAAILTYTQKNASLYELRLKFGPLKCLHYLFYPNRAYFFGTRTIFTRARTTSPKVPARVRILVRHG